MSVASLCTKLVRWLVEFRRKYLTTQESEHTCLRTNVCTGDVFMVWLHDKYARRLDAYRHELDAEYIKKNIHIEEVD